MEPLADDALEPRQLWRITPLIGHRSLSCAKGRTTRRSIPTRKEEEVIEVYFYLDPDFPCLWGRNFHLLNREWFSWGPGNSSLASDNLEATKRNTLHGNICLQHTVGGSHPAIT